MNDTASTSRSPLWRSVWRWHFYAGLFCIPFVLWLAFTGCIYLFKPQIDAWQEREYNHLQLEGAPASASAQVQAALSAVPGGTLNAYELPRTPQSAARVLVGRGADVVRVYVNPQTLAVLGTVDDSSRFTRLIFRLHGELLLGDTGSMLVELAASWAVVMIVTGLYLWWPREVRGFGGIVYPRLRRGGRVFWRDLHAVIGLWVSAFALFLIVSGLPWAHFWGGNLKALRDYAAQATLMQDWTTGSGSERAQTLAQNTPTEHAGSEHAMHDHAHMDHAAPASAPSYAPLDRIALTVAALHLPPPVLITPPSKASAQWAARSDTQNRPQRVSLTLDAESGAVLTRTNFTDRALLDRIIGIGVAAHEGQLFGWINQALGVFTALSLILLSVSAYTLWWKRRPKGSLGAPAAQTVRVPWGFKLAAVGFGVFLPLMGLSLIGVLLLDRLVTRLRAA